MKTNQWFTQECINRWSASMKLAGRSLHTVRAYSADATALMNWLGTKNFATLDIATQHYLATIRSQHADTTFNRKVISIRRFAKFIGEQILDDYICPKPVLREPKVLEMWQVDKMIDMAMENERKDIALVIALQGKMGLRVAETLAITGKDVDLDDMILRVRGKGSKTRYIPIPSSVVDMIVSNMKAKPTTPLVERSYSGTRSWVERIGKQFHEDFSTHWLRATLSTAVMENGTPDAVAGDILGHGDPRTTRRYQRVAMERKREALELA